MFKPKDFLEIAKILVKDNRYKNLAEARNRTVISRSYYAAFLTAREALQKVLPTCSDKRLNKLLSSPHVHRIVIDILKYVDPLAGNVLASLRKLRNTCDYDLSIHIDENTANDAINRAETVICRICGKKLDEKQISKVLSKLLKKF